MQNPLVVNPRRRYYRDADRLRVAIPGCAKSVQGAPALAALLDQLAAEPAHEAAALAARLTAPIYAALVKHFVLLPECDADALQGGFAIPASTPAGASLAAHDLDLLAPGDAVLCHAPFATTRHAAVPVARGGRWVRHHLATTVRAPAGQPGWLVDLDFGTRLAASQLRLFDLGDVCFDPVTDPAERVGQRAGYATRQIAARGARPILLGGDHALAYYTIGALAERYPRLGVLHFDAHPDLYTVGGDADRAVNHANVFHHVRQMPHVETIWQIGIRDLYHQPLNGLTPSRDPKLRAISAFEIATAGYGRLLAQLDPTLPWFVSFDVDVLDGADIPSTATPVLGGIAYYPLLQLFEQLCRQLDLVGFEFVELGDDGRDAHGPAVIAARLIGRYLFHLRGAEPCDANIFTTEFPPER